eukprot:883110-Alexandrium_andersonii.AAC.1
MVSGGPLQFPTVSSGLQRFPTLANAWAVLALERWPSGAPLTCAALLLESEVCHLVVAEGCGQEPLRLSNVIVRVILLELPELLQAVALPR